jgi:chromate transporter
MRVPAPPDDYDRAVPPESATSRPQSPGDLFVTFTLLALQGFGGVLAVAQRTLCDKKRWLTSIQFVEVLALGQVLPGPNVCNVSLIVGDRFFGWRGAFAALAGMMTIPLVVVLSITIVYVHFASVPAVAGALKGMGAVSAGLIIGTAIKLTKPLRGSVMGVPACIGFAAFTFVAIALLRWPLIWVLLVLGALAWSFSWWRIGRTRQPPP